MPGNPSIIAPSEEVTGSVSLPIARVKKTIAADEDIGPVSAQATFVIAKATELFIQYAADRAWDMAKTETKPKKSLTYNHIANAVARTDNLEFLSDIVPQTTTMRAHRARKAQEAENAAESRKGRAPMDPKQTTLPGVAALSGAEQMDTSGQSPALLQADNEAVNSMQPATTTSIDGQRTNLVFQHYAPNGSTGPGHEDVDMS